MISTKALCCFTADSPPTIGLGREKHIQKEYDLFCKEKRRGQQFLSRVKEILDDQEYYFIENDFPYYTEKDTTHMVCWYKKGTVDYIMKKIKKNNKIITYWENLPQNKSIPEISHIHIFINK
jgi:hypothetical protein